MKRLLLACAFILAFMGFTVTTSHAQTQPQEDNRWGHTLKDAPISDGIGIGPRIGYFLSDDADDGAWQAGIQTRLRFGPIFGLELAFDYQGRQQFILDTDDNEIDIDERDVQSIPITLSGLIHAPISAYFVPYGIAGVGIYFQFEDLSDAVEDRDEWSTDLGAHLGAGIEVPFNRNLAFHFDWRYVFLDEGLDLNGHVMSGSMFTSGITYYFRKDRGTGAPYDRRR